MDIILEGIETAIEEEIADQKKYKKLKEKADDQKLKALFEQLIQDEEKHEEILRSRYEAVKKMINDD
ncbi:ferritin family protein [Halanaerobacter jeridensis]|uniref:Rubrerythrin n=1 Tax=Halanaerobacter jeridensis TaxID=706427 RepID=A0A938XS23_9FIRM|nr:ferritin family protein [Halanaerobacter jeridensis]MBM7556754.1 rubrerythrin [Halanaerobacter jeridensis]